MKRRLEDFIHENRDQLDQASPSEGHFDRFEQLLSHEEVPKKRSFVPLMRIAAILVVLVIAGSYVFLSNPGQEEGTTELPVTTAGISLKDISPEMAEVESFFSAQINNLAKDAPEATHHLTQLETAYEQLKIELASNYGDERIIRAMIRNYRLRLQVLEQHLELKQFQQTIKNKKNEEFGI